MKITRFALSTAAFVVTAVICVSGQDRKSLSSDDRGQYVVSARAGAVNATEGSADFKRGKGDWDPLIAGDDLRTGDTVKTGTEGLVEILLNPGSFLRLASNTEFVFDSTSTYNLRLSITRGSAIVEASAVDAPIKVMAGNTRFLILRGGLYRFMVEPNGDAEVLVRKGRIEYAGKTIKDGKKISVVSGNLLISKFDKKVEDSFDEWSKGRSRSLIAANKKLSERVIRRSVSLGWGGNLWLYDPIFGYTFLPFGRFSSPYGGGYRTCNPYYNGWGNSGGGQVGGYRGGGYGGNTGGGSAGSSGGSGGGRVSGGATSAPSSGVPAGGRLGAGGADANPGRAKQH